MNKKMTRTSIASSETIKKVKLEQDVLRRIVDAHIGAAFNALPKEANIAQTYRWVIWCFTNARVECIGSLIDQVQRQLQVTRHEAIDLAANAIDLTERQIQRNLHSVPKDF